eukprot:SAG11_NODE_8961_length_958_cov_1.738068_1_plen_37_part_01
MVHERPLQLRVKKKAISEESYGFLNFNLGSSTSTGSM